MDTWYRINIEYHYEHMNFFIQSHNIREQKRIFHIDIKGLHRGSIGFATKGNKNPFNNLGNENFLISGINIGKLEKNIKPNDSEKFTFKTYFPNVNKSIRLDYCKEIFVNDQVQIERCQRPHIYCKYKCDSIMSKLQNIINYSCYIDCVRQTKVEIINSNITKTEENKKEDEPINFLNWVPTLNAKCDYKPDGMDSFVNAIVKKLTEVDGKKFASLEYQNSDGTLRNVNVEYPSVNLLECGKGIVVRTDCKS